MQNYCNETKTRIAIPVIKGWFPIVVRIKKQTSVYLWSLKQPSALLFELLGKIMFILKSTAKFLPSFSALLFIRLLRVFFKLQTDFTDAGRIQIHYFKKKNFHPFILPWQRYFIEEGNFQNTKHFWIFLKQLASC